MKKMEEIFVSNKCDLMKTLSGIDITALRSGGRTKEFREAWSICHWLSTYPNLAYPIRLIHRNKPDFYLKSGDQEFGIEHTDAIPSDYAHARAISEKNDDETVLDRSLFKWGQKKKPREIYEIASRTKLTGLGWEGDSPEIEWSVAIAEVIKNKTALLREKDFRNFSTNFLLIYENLTTPNVDFSKACSLLKDSLKSYWGSGLIFDSIFVQTDDMLRCFGSSRLETFKNNKIW
jgi:hypothetical protein